MCVHACLCMQQNLFLEISCSFLHFNFDKIIRFRMELNCDIIHSFSKHTHTHTNKHYYVNTYYTNIQFRNQFFHLSSTQIVKCLSVRQRREECVLLYELLMKHYIKKAC